MRKVYQEIAALVNARHACRETGNAWMTKHTEALKTLVSERLPSGGGFDTGTHIDIRRSEGERLVFRTSYHHMVDGCYAGWTYHTVTVTPSLQHWFRVEVGGRNRDGIKDVIAEAFTLALSADLPEPQS